MLSPRILFGAGLVLAFGSLPLPAIVDRNADGLSDVWAALYRPNTGAGVDEDGDGFTNAQEALAGTDPLNAASRLAAASQTDTAGNLVLRWRGAWGKRYLVESSVDLKTWTTLPELHVGRGQELSVIVRAAGAAPEARRYWRVAVADVDDDKDGMTNAEEIELGSDPTTKPKPEAPALGTPRVYGAEYFVSPTGDDTNAGTKAKPFRTLEKAQVEARAKIAAGTPAGGIAVWLRGGVYERTETLALTAADSGTSVANSVDWRGWPGEEARMIGGKRLDASKFTLVTSASPVWTRLDATARGKVRQIDLKAQGLTDYGTMKPRGYAGAKTGSALELFVDAQPMVLARWPDVGTSTMQDPGGATFRIYGASTPDVSGSYTKAGTVDGVSLFKRDSVVGGSQYYIYRYTWLNGNGNYESNWYIATTTSGHPTGLAPAWVCGGAQAPTRFARSPSASGDGSTLTALDPARINDGQVYTATGTADLQVAYLGDRPGRWRLATDAWMDGFWTSDYADFHVKIGSIDTVGRVITMAEPPYADSTGRYDGNKPGRNWFAFNLLEEITQPGEWFLDRDTGILYLRPPAGFGAGSDVVVSILNEQQWLCSIDNAQFLTLRDLVLEAVRGTLVEIKGTASKRIALRGLVLRNTGAKAIDATDGDSYLISRCTISGVGTGGVKLAGGDRLELASSNHVMEDCEVHHISRSVPSGMAGVYITGCGVTVRNNYFHHGGNSAIVYGGNNHRIEQNEIHDMCTMVTDAGAIYTGGGWGTRGTAIRHNFIHDLRSNLGIQVMGLYVDNTGAGTLAEGNVFYAIQGTAIAFGGGRDSKALNNAFANCRGTLSASAQGMGFTVAQIQQGLDDLVKHDYQHGEWLASYPECAAIPTDPQVLLADKHWLASEGSVFARNISWQSRSPWIWNRAAAET